jgi:cytochrome c nitrite reductase small subunit
VSHDREARPAARSTRGKAWPLTAAVAVGLLAGLGGFTFVYGDGAAYLSNDPAACANCHVMQDHFDSWQKSGHRHVAVCNDCHLPPSFADKWLTKLDNGMMHSLVFTTGGFPNPIRIKPRNRRRTQAACLHCHGALVEALAPVEPGGDTLTCADCHRDVGHALR